MQRNMPIEEVEKQLNWKCVYDCHWQCMVFSGTDRNNQLCDSYRRIKKERKNPQNMFCAMTITGHMEEDTDDLASIEYDAYCIHFLLMRKWKYISDLDFVSAIENMKKIGIKVPKAAWKKYKRILRKSQENK